MEFNKHTSTQQVQQHQVHFHTYKCITLLLWEHICWPIFIALSIVWDIELSLVSFTSQQPLSSPLERGLSHDKCLHPFQLTYGSPVPWSELYSSHCILYPHPPPPPVIMFFTIFITSVFRGLLFFLTFQQVNLRSLVGHLSSPEHLGVSCLLSSIPPFQIHLSHLFSNLTSAPLAGLKALYSSPFHFPQSADGQQNARKARGKAVRQKRVSQERRYQKIKD